MTQQPTKEEWEEQNKEIIFSIIDPLVTAVRFNSSREQAVDGIREAANKLYTLLTQQEAKMQDMARKMVGEERSEKLKDSMGRVLTNIKNRGYNAHRAHCIAVAKEFGVDLTK